MTEQAMVGDTDNVRVAVYGSLISGLHNHGVIKNGTLLGKDRISVPYRMVSLFGFPGLITSDKNHEIEVEVYECDPETFGYVRRLEGYDVDNPERGLYREDIAETKYGPAISYIYNNRRNETFEGQDHIDDWKKFYLS